MKKPADQGPVGPGWKLAWIEAVARDLPDAAGSPLAVATVISWRVDSYGVVKNLTHQQIAKRLNISVRAVAKGYATLIARGHVEILKESCGRGRANEIKVVRKDDEKNLPNRAYLPDLALQANAQKHARSGQKTYPNVHTLPSLLPDSFQDPPPPTDFVARCWTAVLTRLSQSGSLGKREVQQWLCNGKVGVRSIQDGTVTLMARDTFIADNVKQRSDFILQEWRQVNAAISSIVIKVGPVPENSATSASAAVQDVKAASASSGKVLSLREKIILAQAATGQGKTA